MTMTYEAWRISFQNSEQAARGAYAAAVKHAAECDALAAHMERIIREWNSGDDQFSDEWISRMGDIVEDAPETSLAQRDARVTTEALDNLVDSLVETGGTITIAGIQGYRDEIAAGGEL